MTGLEKILADIKEEATATAGKKTQAAKAQAEEILEQARKEAASAAAQIESATKKQEDELKKRQLSAQELARRQTMLAAKQEILTQALKKAQEKAEALPDAEYFDLCLAMAVKAAEPREGLILFGQKDLDRMPSDFMEKLQRSVKSGAKLTLGKAENTIQNGFVLSYGGVEEDCTFDAVFSARESEFRDICREILFREEA